jgi:hypothetical protein
VDYFGEAGYQAYLKNNFIRQYVSNTTDAVLFDFSDILAWDDAGHQEFKPWTDTAGNSKFYEWIADDNYKDFDGAYGTSSPYHVGQRGALRLGKALWWLLANLGASKTIPTSLRIEVVGGGTILISINSGPGAHCTLQCSPGLNAPSWSNITSGIANSAGVLTFNLPVDSSSGFFRSVSP